MDDSTQAAMTAGAPVTGEEMPVPPPEVVEAAREAPDHWLAMVDLTWVGEGAPPLWAVIGQWRSGPDGTIVEWRDNPEYRPSPQMLEWADPTDPVDRAVQPWRSAAAPATCWNRPEPWATSQRSPTSRARSP
ncbi:type VII secretion system-associated protein, partial [Streptomyces noursei]